MPIVEVPILSEPESSETPDELMRRKYREYKEIFDVLHAHCPPETFTDNSVVVELQLEFHLFEDYARQVDAAEAALQAYSAQPTEANAAVLQQALEAVAQRVAAYDRYLAGEAAQQNTDDMPF